MMPLAFLTSGMGRIIVIGVVVVGLAGALYMQVRANGRIAADRDRVLKINEENAALLTAQTDLARSANQIAVREAANAELWRRRFNAMRMEIVHAKPEDDGPLAPVLRSALDRLPEPGGNKTDSASHP